MPKIHPSSVIDPGATIADDAEIGPLCYVAGSVSIGSGTRLISGVHVLGRTTIGSGNTIWPGSVLGAVPQDLKYRGEESELIIGNDNDIREMVTAHIGTAIAGGVTRIGSNNLLMANVHVAHDCEIGDFTIIANSVGLAGHVKVEDHANIAGVTRAHHFVTFGQYCFVGGFSRIVHDVPPFMVVEGNPASVRGVNSKGLARHRFEDDQITLLKTCYKRLFLRAGDDATPGFPGVGGTMLQRVKALVDEYGHEEVVTILCDSVRRAAESTFGRYRETLRQDKKAPTA